MSRRNGASYLTAHRPTCLTTLAIAVGLALSASASAQESGKTWTIAEPGGQAGNYATQQQAVQAFQAIQNPIPVWGQVNKIKDTQVSANGGVTVSYWMGNEQPNDPNWSYVPLGDDSQAQLSEPAALAIMQADLDASNPDCPAGSLTLVQDWHASAPGTEGRIEEKTYNAQTYSGGSGPDDPCEPLDLGETNMVRQRRLQCPVPFTEWKDEYNGCVNTDFIAKVTSAGEECDMTAANSGPARTSALVGNPCNFKTGEKYETETDVDLGWIAFSRYYHSGIASTSGSFGPGWTHSHSAKLAITGPTIALIDGSGYQLRFRQDGTNYWATDNSGERLVHSGSQWVLYRATSIMTFDATGRLASQQAEHGTSLSYNYDSFGRLDAITHSTGRSLKLTYNGDAAEATIASISSAGVSLATYGYGPKGQVASVTYPSSGTRTYHYEDTRYPLHLTGITAEDSVRFSTFTYDNKGRVVSSQHAGGADGVTLAYSTQPQGGAVVTDALGHETTYGLTATPASGVPRKVGNIEDSRGTLKQSYYDETADFRRRLSEVEDRRGIKTQHSYTEANDPVTGQPARTHSTQEAVGLPQQRNRLERVDIASNRLIFSKLGDRETRISRNARFQPITVSIKDTATSETRTTTFAYCEAVDVAAPNSTCPTLGLIKTVDGPRADVSDVVTFSYYGADDASCVTNPTACLYRKGDLWKITDALGRSVETLGYDALGRPLSQMDINGVVTDSSYHLRGWKLSTKVRGPNNASEADDRVTLFDYWPTGLVKKVTLPDGSFTTYTYDAAQRLTDVTDNGGDTIHYTLDAAGNRRVEDTKTSGGMVKRTLSRAYNTLGQLEADKNAGLYATTYGYDAENNIISVTDPLLRKTTQDRDPLNRLSRTLEDVGGTNSQTKDTETKYTYNVFDQLTQVTDPKGLNTIYSYNAYGDRIQLNSPDTGITTYTHDARGNVKTETDSRGVVQNNSYDALNRLTSTVYPDSSLNVTYTFDTAPAACPAGEQFSKGRRATMTDGSGTTVYCYDRFGQLVRKIQTTNGVSFTIKYAYNLAGQLTALTYPDGTVADYTRDSRGRVATVGVTSPGSTRELLLTVTGYNPFGPATGWTYGNGRALVRTYDLNYAVQSLRDTAVGGLDLGFVRNELLQVTAIHNPAPAPTARVKFDYDELNRLTKFRDGGTDIAQEAYDYDKTGNRTKFTNNGGSQDYGYPGTSHRLGAVGAVARGYDAAGNTTSIGGTAKEFVYGDNGRMTQVKQAGALVMSYAYNGAGERVRSYLGASNTYTLYDETGRWLGDYGVGGAAIQQAIWLDSQPVGLVQGPSTVAGRLRYIQPDHIGTPRSVVDPIRNVAVWNWDITSEAFGNSSPNQDPDLDAIPYILNMRFPGQRFDAATGMSYNYFRDMDPGTGRYVQSDPIGLTAGISTYAYVENSPLDNQDSLGLQLRRPGFNPGRSPAGPSTPVRDPRLTGDPAYDATLPNSQTDTVCRTPDFDRNALIPLVMGFPHLLLYGATKYLTSEHPGFWSGDRGAEEWGRRNGINKDRARNRFHDIKQSDKGQGGGKGLDDYLVNPDTGDVMAPDGEIIGNMEG